MDSGSIFGNIGQINNTVFAETVGAMNSKWDVYRALRAAIQTVAAGSHQFPLAEGFKKNRLPPIGMDECHISRVGYSQEFPVVVGVTYRSVWRQMMESAFKFIFIIFDIYLSEHAHNISPCLYLRHLI
jgi:hypothetical protein